MWRVPYATNARLVHYLALNIYYDGKNSSVDAYPMPYCTRTFLILFRRLLSRGHELNVGSIGCHGSANNHNFLDNFFLSLERDFVLFLY